ncbi:MAG TPA: metal-sensitive transcriptional regulator [Acidimicrobiales bacterium]|nr:metal-sensitive transcriptional regulator [Acidimicrobiales bacterium]
MERGYSGHTEDVQKRLKRIEGQVRGLQRMVEEDTYCIDILTQISAATKALRSVALELLGDHLSHCVYDALQTGGSEAESKVREARDAIERLVRS